MLRHIFQLALVASTSLALWFSPPPPPPPDATELHVPILMYHYVSANPKYPDDPERTRLSITPAEFAAQLRYLHDAGYTTIALDDLASALHDGSPLPRQPIILTFDDGYQDFFDNAYPLLKKFDDRATIYVITGKVDHPGYMTWSELGVLARSPLITIGAHTRTHPDLAALSPTRSWDELAGSKSDLENKLAISVRDLAYPSGEYNQTTLVQAAEIGFETAVTTREGLDERSDGMLRLERVRVNGYAGLADLIEGLAGRRASPLKARPSRKLDRLCHNPVARFLDGMCVGSPFARVAP